MNAKQRLAHVLVAFKSFDITCRPLHVISFRIFQPRRLLLLLQLLRANADLPRQHRPCATESAFCNQQRPIEKRNKENLLSLAWLTQPARARKQPARISPPRTIKPSAFSICHRRSRSPSAAMQSSRASLPSATRTLGFPQRQRWLSLGSLAPAECSAETPKMFYSGNEFRLLDGEQFSSTAGLTTWAAAIWSTWWPLSRT